MPNRSRADSVVDQLPPCEGPKLGLFKHHNSKIQWLERLGDQEDDEASATQGYVFRAKIERREYAVKVFKFYDPTEDKLSWQSILGPNTSLHTVGYYTDPFYAECRAYGRINQTPKSHRARDIVVPCHGYLFLKERDQRILSGRAVDLELDSVDRTYQWATPGRFRPRAIVKDLASNHAGVDEHNLCETLAGIARLNGLGIYNMDVRLPNFRDGKLVDFGSSETEPHLILNGLDHAMAIHDKWADRGMFDMMVEDEEIPNPKNIRALHPMRLRSEERKR